MNMNLRHHQIIASTHIAIILILQCIISNGFIASVSKPSIETPPPLLRPYTIKQQETTTACLSAGTDESITSYEPSNKNKIEAASVEKHVLPEQQTGTTFECPKQASPGSSENVRFNCDDSVTFWSEFQLGGPEDASSNIQRVLDTVTPYLTSGDATAVAYWTSHLLRTGYFTTNAILGLVGHSINQRLSRDRLEPSSSFNANFNSSSMSRLLLEAILVYEQDWRSVADNEIQYPWDATITPRLRPSLHRQTSPFFAAAQTMRLVRESMGVLDRRDRMATGGDGLWMSAGGAPSLSSKLYPDYYLNDFHYQTDGWLSSRSANTYEVSTETLFLGRQDGMQRRAIVALNRMKRKEGGRREVKRILEVACGTGRFGTFLREEYPDANVTMVDLSAFYLEKARENDDYWRRRRGRRMGGEVPSPATFVQANAEALPFDDCSFDAVFCTYLFHELPDEARVRSAQEMARVVAQGGVVVFTDSHQLGDRPALAVNLANFQKLNEPHYPSYVETDLPTLFEQCGLECVDKDFASVSKTLSFVKPEK